MSRARVPTVVLIAAALVVALLVYGVIVKQRGKGSNRLDKQVAQGKRPPAPKADLARPLLSGAGEQRLAALKGKVVVLNFYASWCDPCRAEAPVLEHTQQMLQSTGTGTVIGVTYHDAHAAAAGFLTQFGLTYPALTDPGDSLFDAYGLSGIPETFVLDRQGRLTAIDRGQVQQPFLDQAIAKASQS